MFYNLDSNQADRMNFDNMVALYATGMLDAITLEEIMLLDVQEYMEDNWDGLFASLSVDNEDEARSRFDVVFTETLHDHIVSKLEDKVNNAFGAGETGERVFFVAVPGDKLQNPGYLGVAAFLLEESN